jgi:hypothetical protein
MGAALVLLLVLVAALPVAAQDQASSTWVQSRRVGISLTFSGQDVFYFGRALPGTESILAVMEGPPAGEVRLMEQGRAGPFWLGVRQYRLAGVPGVYLVNGSGPVCGDLRTCFIPLQPAERTPVFASPGLLLGPEAIRARAHLTSLSGDLTPEEARQVLDGYWQLQARRDLYVMRSYAIRIGQDGVFYHRFTLPTQAPEGRYRITTRFLAGDRLFGTAEDELFLHKTGVVAWLSRLAERQALAYGGFTLLIALTAGWLAGTIFRRGGGH